MHRGRLKQLPRRMARAAGLAHMLCSGTHAQAPFRRSIPSCLAAPLSSPRCMAPHPGAAVHRRRHGRHAQLRGVGAAVPQVHGVGGEVDQQVASVLGQGHGDEGLDFWDVGLRVGLQVVDADLALARGGLWGVGVGGEGREVVREGVCVLEVGVRRAGPCRSCRSTCPRRPPDRVCTGACPGRPLP